MGGSKEGHYLKNLDGVRLILILILMMMTMTMMMMMMMMMMMTMTMVMMMMMMMINILRKSCFLKSTSDIIPVSQYAGKFCVCVFFLPGLHVLMKILRVLFRQIQSREDTHKINVVQAVYFQ